MPSHRKFDGDWDLRGVENEHGGIKTANVEQIQAAQLILIRDAVRELKGSIDSIRHFFHEIGTERMRLIVQEAGIRAAAQRRKRLAAKKRWRAARAEAA